MADKTDKTEHDKAPEAPDLGTVIGTGLLELARTGRLSEPTTAALSEAFDPKPEPTEADTKAADDAAELAELRAARDKSAADADKAPAGTTKGAKP